MSITLTCSSESNCYSTIDIFWSTVKEEFILIEYFDIYLLRHNISYNTSVISSRTNRNCSRTDTNECRTRRVYKFFICIKEVIGYGDLTSFIIYLICIIWIPELTINRISLMGNWEVDLICSSAIYTIISG